VCISVCVRACVRACINNMQADARETLASMQQFKCGTQTLLLHSHNHATMLRHKLAQTQVSFPPIVGLVWYTLGQVCHIAGLF